MDDQSIEIKEADAVYQEEDRRYSGLLTDYD